ncbi:MAG: hypothetical protein LBI87_15795 [Candidatus Accumulibacter sp.]|nr:hypothetical protein [Accumulibacter sp.]
MLIAALATLLICACAGNSMSTAERDAARARYQKADAMFLERCKKAGVFIHRTAENVEGIFLLKLRPDSTNYRDQYRMDDPYGHDSGGEYYIRSFFLEPMLQANKYAKPEVLEKIRREYRGYRYVDAIDPKDGKRYRYTGSVKVVGKQDPTAHNTKPAMSRDPNYDLNIYSFVLDRVSVPDPAPRYGVTHDDISTREERDYWIAGSSLKVIDLETNEVMAERIGYMMDRGQGNDSGGRSPWLSAASHACPAFGPSGARQPGFSYQADQTRRFVTKIVKPTLEK